MESTVPLILEEDCEKGGRGYEDGIENDFAYRNNVMHATKNIRLGFIRKVYGLLSMQLALTVIIASIFMFVPEVKLFIHQNDWLLMISMFGSLAMIMGIYFYRKQHPTNFILLIAFTVMQSYTIGVIVTMYAQDLVIQAFFLTLVVVVGLTLYTFQTKRDFSSMYSALFAGLLILIIGGFMQIFIQSSAMEIALSLGGALLFSLFIIFDTQLIMARLSPEEYIIATIDLYLDIINLFLYILRILAASRK